MCRSCRVATHPSRTGHTETVRRAPACVRSAQYEPGVHYREGRPDSCGMSLLAAVAVWSRFFSFGPGGRNGFVVGCPLRCRPAEFGGGVVFAEHVVMTRWGIRVGGAGCCVVGLGSGPTRWVG